MAGSANGDMAVNGSHCLNEAPRSRANRWLALGMTDAPWRALRQGVSCFAGDVPGRAWLLRAVGVRGRPAGRRPGARGALDELQLAICKILPQRSIPHAL